MEAPVNRRRPYDSSGRKARARQNRTAILAAARDLFLEHGYSTATMAAIAAEAGVSVETIYKVFGNKPGLLQALFDVAVGDGDEPIPTLDREVLDQLWAEPDPARKLRLYGDMLGRGAARVQPVQLLARQAAASDPAAAEVYEQIRNERLAGMTGFADFLHNSGQLRADVTVEEARDVLWAYNSAELWELLVVKRGWDAERYGRWIGDALIAALIDPGVPSAPRPR
jgi:AcrR family transcriptional regulator